MPKKKGRNLGVIRGPRGGKSFCKVWSDEENRLLVSRVQSKKKDAVNRTKVKNKILQFLNGPKFDCRLVWMKLSCFKEKKTYFLIGCARDGRTVLIYPLRRWSDRLPVDVARYMCEVETRSPYVGTAINIGDAYTILADNAAEYPRALRTRLHEKSMAFYNNERKNNDESDSE